MAVLGFRLVVLAKQQSIVRSMIYTVVLQAHSLSLAYSWDSTAYNSCAEHNYTQNATVTIPNNNFFSHIIYANLQTRWSSTPHLLNQMTMNRIDVMPIIYVLITFACFFLNDQHH